MKTRYKILLVVTIGFISFWAFTPTIVLHTCAEFDLDWRTTHFCNVNGEMVGDYFVLNSNLLSNPIIQMINQVITPPSCTYDENDESLPRCSGFRESFDGGVLENEN
jgi:hypothetical protein